MEYWNLKNGEPITKAKEATILWDITSQTDRKINKRPFIVIKYFEI